MGIKICFSSAFFSELNFRTSILSVQREIPKDVFVKIFNCSCEISKKLLCNYQLSPGEGTILHSMSKGAVNMPKVLFASLLLILKSAKHSGDGTFTFNMKNLIKNKGL